MPDATDPYWKLRPPAATTEEEICHCPPGGGVMLCYRFSENPLYCVECRGEVPPERLGFDEALAEGIAYWRSVYGSLYSLWLDSGEYEAWARERLLDPQGAVNTRGRELVSQLNRIVPAFYWWFEDTDAEDYEPIDSCPICSQPLEKYKQIDSRPICTQPLEKYKSKTLRVCGACRIMM